MSERLSLNESQEQNANNRVFRKLAEATNYNSKNFGSYSSENTRNYIKDRFFDNLDILNQDIKDDSFIELYKNITEEYPILRTVVLEDKNIKDNASFTWASFQTKDGYVPKVACNLSHPETYAFGKNTNLEKLSIYDRLGGTYFIKRLAFAIGADWKECAKNVRLNADTVFLHEFGHAHDFLENYVRPEYKKTSGGFRSAETLYRAVKIRLANFAEYEKRGPNPDGRWIDRSSKDWRKNERRLKAMGIDNYDEYLYAVHQYYRDKPDEHYADQFAYDYILKHYDKYFTTDRSERSERIFVDKEREIELDPDFVHILGLKQGLGVNIDRLDDDRKSVKHISGFLAMNMYVGKSVYLYENGDPKNPGGKWRICSGISEIKMKPVKDEETGKMNHYVFFKDEDGVEYHMSRTGEEPELVNCSPNEMAEELGLKVGDKVQLIEHQKNDAREMPLDKIKKIENEVIEGKVIRIDGDRTNNDNVVINYQIDNTTTELNYPPQRKWKTWYIGNYEVLPLPEYYR